MNIKIGSHCTLVLVLAAISNFLCGCADQTINRSEVRSAIVADAGGKVKSFKLRLEYIRIDGTLLEGSRKVEGNLTIDAEKNQICLDQIPLVLAGPKVFLWEKKLESGDFLSSIIKINGRSTDGKGSVAISEDDSRVIVQKNGNVFTRSLIKSCQTPNGSFDEFFSYYDSLKFPDNYHGLIASVKYIDGTAVGVGSRFTASIQLVDKRCLLDKKDARHYRSTLANGKGVITISNDDSNLILWPDGNWVFYNLKSPGTRFCGSDDSLEQVYSDLQQTERPGA